MQHNQNLLARDIPIQQLRIVQINLQSCRAASSNLTKFMIDQKRDLACVQDPYVKDNNLPGFPTGWTIFKSINLTAAIIQANSKLKLIQALNTENSIFVNIQAINHSFYVGAFYSPPSANFTDNLSEWECHMAGHSFVISGDFNAKNTLWGCSRNDTRGDLVP